ncbi:LacI family DNA-binding transcriptional regulator [Poseidonocella sp. HB161398]|uniref:LacI family DNA-binding transcriptional regulator n=1 Tax=Poseidonocella sp. HB161398 TaxID=2320855 RepID=UPI001486EC19|nr:LacI family DNA-binding transcriptional regulator [Poseidonocella sp. HB161398]
MSDSAPSRPPTMRDVAKAAGVAVSSVSRTLADPETRKVGAETRSKILRAAEELGYSVNLAAANFRRRASGLILMVMPPRHPVIPVVLDVLHGADTVLAEKGYRMVVSNLAKSQEVNKLTVDLAFGGVPDGILVVSGSLPQDRGRSLLRAGVPTVSALYDLSWTGIPSVVTDDRDSASAVAQRLLAAGHRRFAYLSGPEGNYHETERFRGVSAAIAGAGLAGTELVRIEGDFSAASGEAAGRALLGQAERPTAVIACNDTMAIGLMHVLRSGGLRIPQDVSVVGYDGISWGRYVEPALTTVEIPGFEIGKAGADRLLRLMSGEAAPADAMRQAFPGRYLERASAAPPGA